MKKLAQSGVVAALAFFALALTAEAHALVRSSDPEDGASLDRAPPAVTITFTENPDPKLSAIHVLNVSGQPVERGGVEAVSGDPLKLRVALGSIPNGVYTVNWRTISAVDGHIGGGAFAFGVGVPADEVVPSAASATTSTTPPPTALGVAGRWVLYVGLALLIGGVWVGLSAFNGSRALFALALAGGLVSLLGLAAVAESTRAGAGISWPTFARTSPGSNLALQAVPVVAAVTILFIAMWLRRWWRRLAVLAAGALAALAIFTLTVTRYGQGHFIGEGPLAAGQWRFDITAPAGGGSQLTASFRETISR